MRTIILALVIALSVLSLTHSIGDLTMCTGAEPAAAGAAKGAADAAAATGAGAAAGTLAAANAVGAAGGDALGALIAGNAANWGVSVAPELIGAGAATAASAAGGGGPSAASSGGTLSKLAAGASVANAGLGVMNAIKGQKLPAAPQLTPPTVMPSPDDEAARRAKAAILAKLAARSGRTSTILSSDTLGGN